MYATTNFNYVKTINHFLDASGRAGGTNFMRLHFYLGTSNEPFILLNAISSAITGIFEKIFKIL